MALVRAGARVEHHHALVAVAVGDVELLRLRIHQHMRRPTELRATVGALRLTGTSDLHEEFAVRGELEDLVVLVAVAGDPDVAFRVDVDAMFALRPLATASRPAAQVVPGGIELGDG